MTHIHLDPPPRHDSIAAAFLFGCLIGLVIAALAWWAFAPVEPKAVVSQASLYRTLDIRVRGDNCDRSMKLVEAR